MNNNKVVKDISSKSLNIIETMGEKKKLIIFSLLILFIFYVSYLLSKKKRLLQSLSNIHTLENYVLINSDLNNENKMEKKLCDYYICCAFRPYLIKNQFFDYMDLEMVKRLLRLGVRAMYVDVYNSNLTETAEPIISVGFTQGQWKLSLNKIKFDDFCKLIAITAFSTGFVNNFDDPFILCLDLHTQGNISCLNKMKKIIYKRFKRYLLDNSFTYSKKNIGETKIKHLMRKIIIMSSGGYESSDLAELINYSWDKNHVKKISYEALDPTVINTKVIKLDSNTLKEFNKHNLTLVVPDEYSLFTYNYDPKYFWGAGCQFVFINYNNINELTESYITKFRNQSFVLKPSTMITKIVLDPNQIELEKIGVPKYEDLSIYQEPGMCPERPNENYLLLSDLPNYKDEGSSGLCFLTNETDNECNCDKEEHEDCIEDLYTDKVLSSLKLCCANNKFINPLPRKSKKTSSKDENDTKYYLSIKQCNGESESESESEKISITENNEEFKYYKCKIESQTDLDKIGCLIDTNNNPYKPCPNGWNHKGKLSSDKNLNLCCKN